MVLDMDMKMNRDSDRDTDRDMDVDMDIFERIFFCGYRTVSPITKSDILIELISLS
jgi:hypothetical protein